MKNTEIAIVRFGSSQDTVAVLPNTKELYQGWMLHTTEELLDSWMSYTDVMPKSIDTYNKGIKQFFRYLRENDIKNPNREDVLAYRDYLKQSLKPTTVNLYMETVKLFFQWTAQSGIYPNVAERIKGAKIDTEHKKDYLTSNQVGSVLKGIDRTTTQGKRDYAIVALMVTTGLRCVSVVNADISDIRIAGDCVALFYKGKGHEEKANYVKLAAPVEEAIRDYLKTRGKVAPDAPLFASLSGNNLGGRLSTASVSRLAKRHMVDVGLDSDRLTAHSFRHTAATLNLLNGGTVEETQKLLDHSNINTTLIYSHAIERANNNSEIRIASAIF